MKKLSFSLVLLVALGVGSVPGPAEGVQGKAQIVVYFDSLGTMRAKDSPGSGVLDTVYVFGENFDFFVGGAQYSIDYGPHMSFVVDIRKPPVSIGTSEAGISVGFGLNPRPGKKFTSHWALVTWNDCTGINSDFPVVMRHSGFPEPTAIVTNFADNPPVPIEAFGARSQTCQFVELDIQPAECPNPFDLALWDTTSASDRKGGALTVAILGSASVDVADIDPTSCRLEGVSPLSAGSIGDIATADGSNNWTCNDQDGDGQNDLRLQYLSRDIAAALPTPSDGDTLTLTLVGCYNDGMPFTTSDCVVIVASVGTPAVASIPAELGLPTPNPFNPITRITYVLPATQHVRLDVFDVRGRLVETLVDEVKSVGDYVVDWNANGLASGVYFYRLTTGSETVVRRATLLK